MALFSLRDVEKLMIKCRFQPDISYGTQKFARVREILQGIFGSPQFNMDSKDHLTTSYSKIEPCRKCSQDYAVGILDGAIPLFPFKWCNGGPSDLEFLNTTLFSVRPITMSVESMMKNQKKVFEIGKTSLLLEDHRIKMSLCY